MDRIKKSAPLSFDIEVSFPEITYRHLHKITNDTPPPGFSLENKESLGWGGVISKDDEIFGNRDDISIVATDLLKNISQTINAIRKENPTTNIILRIGIYYESYSLTISLNHDIIRLLNEFDIEIEISTYPSGD